VTEPSLPAKIEAIHATLDAARIEHAFGGALALAYYAEPRATDDIDVNVFLRPERIAELGDVLRPLGVITTPSDEEAAMRDGQCRLWWGRTPVDVFLASDKLHDAMRAERRLVPFGDVRIPILAPEHLLFCKVLFDRSKDWLDAEQMIVCVDDLNVGALLGELDRAVGEDDQRTARFKALLGRA